MKYLSSNFLIILLFATQSLGATLKEANQAFLNREFNTAILEYSSLIGVSDYQSEQPLILYQIGYCHEILNNWELAHRYYDKIITDYSSSDFTDNAYLQMANHIYNMGMDHITEAYQIYANITSLFPNSDSTPDAMMGVGRCQLRMKMFLSSQKTFQSFLKKYPNHENVNDVHYELGLLYSDVGNPERDSSKAIQSFLKIAENQNYYQRLSHVYYALGNLNWERKKYKSAIDFFQRIVSRYSDSLIAPLALTNIGLCYTEMNENDKAAASYKKLLRNYAQPSSVAENIQKLIDRLQMDKLERLEVSSWNAWLGETGKIAHYTGDVEVNYGKVKILANSAKLNISENIMMLEGNVRLSWSNKLTVTGDKAQVNFVLKHIMLSDRVQVMKRQGSKVFSEEWAAVTFSIENGTYLGEDEQMEMK